MKSPLRFLLRLVAVLGVVLPGFAAEPFLRPHDVIAIVGGEDMVVMSEYGYLELLLTRALPDHQLRFRNLAWEGDTVFEQRRDLNFPTLEEQLDRVGATVVLAQFGQMESIEGEGKAWTAIRSMNEPRSTTVLLPTSTDSTIVEARQRELALFVAAYEKLIGRIKAGGKRRFVLATVQYPERLPKFDGLGHYTTDSAILAPYDLAIEDLGKRIGVRVADFIGDYGMLRQPSVGVSWQATRDGFHKARFGQQIAAMVIGQNLGLKLYDREELKGNVEKPAGWLNAIDLQFHNAEAEPLRQLIVAKNRLWFDYWRVQNWAFLAGDRTTQPSSRDHLDPSKRWFPPEREAFLPLIEAKEKEIDALAQKLSKP